MQDFFHSNELAQQHPLWLSVEKLEIGPRGTFICSLATGFALLDWFDFAQTSDLLGKLNLDKVRCTLRCSVMSHAHLIRCIVLCIFFHLQLVKMKE